MTTLFEQDLYIRFLLPPTATEDDIKKAFRKFAIMAHPGMLNININSNTLFLIK